MNSKLTISIALACGIAIGLGGGWAIFGNNDASAEVTGEIQTASRVAQAEKAADAPENSDKPRRFKRKDSRRGPKGAFEERHNRRFSRDGRDGRPRKPAEDPKAVYKMPLGEAPVTGATNAKITIIEVSDYECPFCVRGNDTIEEVLKRYPDTVRVAMKQNPLGFHKYAKGAANAALAAGEQGKYWEMHHQLFEATKVKTPLTEETIAQIAQQLGLNEGAILDAVRTNKFGDRILREQEEAKRIGARGTPAFFINGRKISGARPIEKFVEVIDEELKRADEALANGAPANHPNALYEYLIKDGLTQVAPPPANPFAELGTAQPVTVPEYAPAMGPKDAKVTLIEFLDFECKHSGKAYADAKQLVNDYAGKVQFIFRHQPLSNHPNAKSAALAAMAAAKQGKFWEMADKLYENYNALSENKIQELAGQIGLDVGAFNSDWKSAAVAQWVNADMADAQKLNIQGTPTSFINGKLLIGFRPMSSFKEQIDKELAATAQP